ncbi:hypothetical protein CLV92_1209 [Kineococcus xinjiangensis]|uniref:Uncharacterized protein n=1 Tax=Kineococcus xinjiangensis TaxID=512762 RepID=A0A2S6ICK3_9ACTN|nr:hypothetical protein [Kineococcus xinjiangensis]PPK91890.1 hypothetical protein CLV92_1209 [Kineococcus xinjiangensis]
MTATTTTTQTSRPGTRAIPWIVRRPMLNGGGNRRPHPARSRPDTAWPGSMDRVSDTPARTRTRPAGAGGRWNDTEDAQLVRELAAGLTIADIAKSHNRTRGAIESRCSRMVPEGEGFPDAIGERVNWLRDRLSVYGPTAGVYDWRQALSQARAKTFPATTEELRAAWQQREPLPQLAARLNVREGEVARQLVRRGIATDAATVVTHLGVTRDTPLARRASALTAAGADEATRDQAPFDDAGATSPLGVLIGVDSAGIVRHVSLHTSPTDVTAIQEQQAERLAAAVLGARRLEGAAPTAPVTAGDVRIEEALTWYVTERRPNDPSVKPIRKH